MRLNTHLSFNGQCREAFEYYEKCLGGRITMAMTYGDSPMADRMPSGMRDKIIHATFTAEDQVLTGADSPPDRYQAPQGFYVLLSAADATEADRIFSGLAENGTVQMALQETFWALKFGMLVDQFGIPWMLNCARA